MATKIADLLIKLGADTLGIEKMTHDVKKQLRGLQKDLQGVGKRLSLSLTAPLMAAGGASVYLADVQQQAERRLLVALRGREDVQKRLIRQAGELQSRSLYGDEELIGQQAYLASLGMTEQQIGRVIEASAQLASATGMSLDSAVKNLAKTYGGLTGELGESIPRLKELTTEQLKNGEAVDFILQNYKGFAEGVAETGLGPLKQLKNALGDLGEEFGAILMPAVQGVVGWLRDLVGWLQDLSPTTKAVVVWIGSAVAAIGPLVLGLAGIIKLLSSLKTSVMALYSPVTLTVGAVALLAVGLIRWVTSSTAAERAAKRMEQRLSEGTRAIAAERYEIDQLFARLKAAKEGTEEYASARQQILDRYGTYLSRLGDEKTALKDIAGAYREVVRESAKAARERTMNQIAADSAASYAEAQSEAYDKAKKLLEREFRGQKTEEGIDLPTYYLKELKKVIIDGEEMSDEVRQIIKKFDVKKFFFGDPMNGVEAKTLTTNELNDALLSLRYAKEFADDAVAAADAKWGPTEEDNAAAEKQVGLIERLEKELADLQGRRKKALTEGEIAGFTVAIEELQKKLNRLNKLGTEGLLGQLEQKIAGLEEAKKKEFDPKKIIQYEEQIRKISLFLDKVSKNTPVDGLGLSPLKALLFTDKEIADQRRKIDQLRALANESPDNPVLAVAAQRAEDSYRGMLFKRVMPAKFDPNDINPSESDWTDAKDGLRANLANFIKEAQGMVLDMTPMLTDLFQGLAVGIGEGLGNFIGDGGVFDDLLASFGKIIGQFLKSLGAQLIQLGTEMLAIKEALKAAFKDPYIAIAVGIAAIATGSAIIAAFNRKAGKGVALAEGGLAYGPTMALVGDNRGAGSDPEVIAPLSKLRQYGLGRQTISFVGGEFRLSGSDLLLSIRREDARIHYVNALA